ERAAGCGLGLGDAELGVVDPARREAGDARRQVAEGERRLRIRVGDGDRDADIAAFAQGGHEWDLAQQRDVELIGEELSASRAEYLVALAVVAGEPTHVLDDAAHREVDLPGHEPR